MSGLGNIATDKNNFTIITNINWQHNDTPFEWNGIGAQITNRLTLFIIILSFSFGKVFSTFYFHAFETLDRSNVLESSNLMIVGHDEHLSQFVRRFFLLHFGLLHSAHEQNSAEKQTNAPKLECTIQPSGIFCLVFFFFFWIYVFQLNIDILL